MLNSVILQFVDLFVALFTILLLVRVLMSYVLPPENRAFATVAGVTEPILAPVRKLLPRTPGIDLAPLVGWILLQLVRTIMHRLLG